MAIGNELKVHTGSVLEDLLTDPFEMSYVQPELEKTRLESQAQVAQTQAAETQTQDQVQM